MVEILGKHYLSSKVKLNEGHLDLAFPMKVHNITTKCQVLNWNKITVSRQILVSEMTRYMYVTLNKLSHLG